MRRVVDVTFLVCPYCYQGDQHAPDCRVPEWNPRLTYDEMIALDCRKRLMPPEEASLIQKAWEW